MEGLPQTIKSDNGSKFISKVGGQVDYERAVELDFSRPSGQPITQTSSFNGRLRQERLNATWFMWRPVASRSVSPDSFTLNVPIAFFIGLVLGGYRWLPSAFFGGLYLILMPHVSKALGKGSEGIASAALLIITIFLIPSGLFSL